MAFHKFDRAIESIRRRIEASDLSDDDKALLLGFESFIVAEGRTLCRRVKLLEYAFLFRRRYLQRELRGSSADEIWSAVHRIESDESIGAWTKRDYKITAKKLFKYVEWGSDALRQRGYPSSVAGIATTVRRRDQSKVREPDLVKEDEFLRLLAATTDAQERAIISMLYEFGCRAEEIGTMLVKSVSRDKYSYLCELNGKTGPRQVRAIYSASALTHWLNMHPQRDEPEAPLWGKMRFGKWTAINYEWMRKRVRTLRNNAGIDKRMNLHVFRDPSASVRELSPGAA